MANTVKVLVHQGTLFLHCNGGDWCKQHLRHAGRSENIKWGRSDLKLGKFKFSDFLECKDIPSTMDLQMRLSERIFVCNNTLGPGIGYTSHELVLGIGSGIPGVYQVSESESSKFAQRLKRIKSGINQTQAQQAPSTLGGATSHTNQVTWLTS